MKISLIGYGKMGSMIEKVALARGHEIFSRIDPFNPSADYKELSLASVQGADVCIEFSLPDSAFCNIQTLLKTNKPIVVGTTGWQDRLGEVENLVKASNNALIHSTNYALGVHIFLRIVKEAAKLIDGFDNYDIAGFESHHNQKADSPSGTARTIADILLKEIKRKSHAGFDRVGKIDPSELHFASLRVGSDPGTHTVLFDSSADTIEMTHRTRNREGLALGAVLAAEWIPGKRGLFTAEDLFASLFGEEN